MEDSGVGLLAAGAHRRHDEVEVVQETVGEQGALEPLVEVRHDAELYAAITQRLPCTSRWFTCAFMIDE